MSCRQLRHSRSACGISERQIAQYPSVMSCKRSAWSFSGTVTDEPSTVMVMAPFESHHSSVISHPVIGESPCIGAEGIPPASIIENESVAGEFTVKRPAHLVLGDVVTVRDGYDAVGIDDGVDKSYALASSGSFNISGLIIWGSHSHFGPPFIC